MGGKRKSGTAPDTCGKAAKKGEPLALPSVPAADVKKQEHLKQFDEWLLFGLKCIVMCAYV